MAKNEEKDQKDKRRKHIPLSKEEKRKLIPPMVMLTAGAVTSILMVALGGSGLNDFLAKLLAILFVFYVLGCILKGILDAIDKQNAPIEPEEGEVIEKGPDGEEIEIAVKSVEEETAEE